MQMEQLSGLLMRNRTTMGGGVVQEGSLLPRVRGEQPLAAKRPGTRGHAPANDLCDSKGVVSTPSLRSGWR